jgi:energy-coupling factor transport system permease protein
MTGRANGYASYLGRRNPVMKLAVLVLAGLVLTFLFDPATPAAILAAAILAGRLSGRLSFRSQLRPLWIFAFAGVAILLANIFFNKNNAASAVMLHLGPVGVTRAALWAAGSLWLRLLAFAVLSLVFVRTTEPQRLVLSLVHQLRLNYRVAFSTLVGYRMLPLLQSDYRTIQAAQRVRGAAQRRGFWHAWSRARRFALPLLAGAVRRASRVAIAMDARAFGSHSKRTYRIRMTVGGADWLFLAASVALIGGLVSGLWLAGFTRFTLG